jgi:hypothetical protein
MMQLVGHPGTTAAPLDGGTSAAAPTVAGHTRNSDKKEEIYL